MKTQNARIKVKYRNEHYHKLESLIFIKNYNIFFILKRFEKCNILKFKTKIIHKIMYFRSNRH